MLHQFTRLAPRSRRRADSVESPAESCQVLIYRERDNRAEHELHSDGFPVLPRHLWNSTLSSFDEFMEIGRGHYTTMRELLDQHGFDVTEKTRVLDFGCGTGRTMRFWKDEPAEVWGCEITGEQVDWCQANLGSRFRFVQTTVHPHLPFEDHTFDLVYAGSVFTHISHLIDLWLLELRRVTKPQGLLYVTIHDETTWRLVKNGQGQALQPVLDSHPEGHKNELDADFISFGFGPASQTFFRRDYFARKAGYYFDVLQIVPEARGYQTAVILRKPS